MRQPQSGSRSDDRLAVFLLREEAKLSLIEIGSHLGGRNHSTVIYSCDKIGEQKGRGQDDLLQPSWRLNEVIASDLRRPELFLLERSQFGKQIEGNPQYKNTTQTVAERNEQFAQQVTV